MPDTSVIRSSSLAQPFFQRLAQRLLKLAGWRLEGGLPSEPRYLVVVHPHTSNWDLPFGLLAALSLGLLDQPYGFMVKDTALRWPVIGRLLRWLGGIGIDRSSRFNAVDQMVAIFRAQPRLMLVITPEGTRRRTHYWKSGFYYIALGAGVPIVPGYLDYRRQRVGLGEAFWLTGDVEADLAHLRDFYADKHGLYPHEAGEIRFRPDAAP